MENNNINNVLIFGNGPVALHLYLTLRKQGSNKVGLKIRDSLKAQKFYEELKKEQFILEGKVKTELPLIAYGNTEVKPIIQNYKEILDEWETFILATPCDAYSDLLENIQFTSLKKLKTIVLVSPELSSAYFIKILLEKRGRNDINIISFSNYFGATNLAEGTYTKIIINALKGKIYLASTNVNDTEILKWVKYLKNMEIEGVICKNPLIAESKNITIFVHSPFLFNDVSLNQIFLKDPQKRYIYKLYPEGPITKYSIQDMVNLYHEIMELYKKMKIETFNLLEFLNDSYPVLEESLHIDEIKSFMDKPKNEQIFLLYVRYCCILIDPYSVPDEEGKYFDFSKVEYSKIFLDKNNKALEPIPANLPFIKKIDSTNLDPRIKETKIIVMCDVSNPLCGKDGASAIYGPQKGATKEDIIFLDQGLLHLVDICLQEGYEDYSLFPGSGAAGGLGFGLMTFLKAHLQSGIETVLDIVDFDNVIKDCDLVISGEGRIDHQSMYGKVPTGVAKRAKKQGIETVCIVGSIGSSVGDIYDFITTIESCVDHCCDIDEALENAKVNVYKAAFRLARSIQLGQKMRF